MSKIEFQKMQEQGNAFLVTKELVGDELTPIRIFYALSGEKKFLLESALKKDDKGRYSFLGANPYGEVTCDGTIVTVTLNGQKNKQTTEKLIDVLDELIGQHPIETTFPFIGGAIGFIGYDTIRQYENIGKLNKDDLDLPESHLLLYRTIIVFDHLLQKVSLIAFCRGQEKFEDIEQEFTRLETEMTAQHSLQSINTKINRSIESNLRKEEFLHIVDAAKKEIKAGNIFQVVLSQRFHTTFEGDYFDLYRKLRISNPSPYLYAIDFGEYQVIGSSPESVVSVKGNVVTTNPIAGTRKRGKTSEEDHQLENELLTDEKERAEHFMLVDLARNDIGFVSKIGSIEIPKLMEIEKYSHVMHLVSEVCGELNDEMTWKDVLPRCLPAGTVSGAPKIEAMTIINELENHKRSIYGGSIGYISFNGSLEMALTIRTMVIKQNDLYVQAGAGIVYDSKAINEYEETRHKARALLEV